MQLSPSARRAMTAASALAFAMAACRDASAPDQTSIELPPAVPVGSASPQIADEYIVILNDEVDDVDSRARGLAAAHGGKLRSTYRAALKGFSATLTARMAEALADDPNVAFVEPNREFMLAGTQTNPAWGLDRIDQATLPLNGTYNYPGTGAGVNVYIIDSGIRRTHTEFGGRVVGAYSAIADGYGADGCHWHGTHVAGVIGGAVYGVAKGVGLHSVRAYDCNGRGTTESILAALDWVTTNHSGPSIANMSISGPASLAVNSAVQRAIDAGVAFVVAAGNNAGADACNYSPAGVSAAITVAAIGGQDAHATFSNVGSCVDLHAPGAQIYAAVPSSDVAIQLNSGTSQAAAFVSGAAALYLQSNPGASPAAVTEAIVGGATSGVVTGLSAGTANRLLRVSGDGGSTPPPPPSGNAAPVANFSFACTKANCTFDGSSSTDDTGIANYSWNWGDGTSVSGTSPKATKQYSTKGNYTVMVTLTVTDAGGLRSSTQKSVKISNKGK